MRKSGYICWGGKCGKSSDKYYWSGKTSDQHPNSLAILLPLLPLLPKQYEKVAIFWGGNSGKTSDKYTEVAKLAINTLIL